MFHQNCCVYISDFLLFCSISLSSMLRTKQVQTTHTSIHTHTHEHIRQNRYVHTENVRTDLHIRSISVSAMQWSRRTDAHVIYTHEFVLFSEVVTEWSVFCFLIEIFESKCGKYG